MTDYPALIRQLLEALEGVSLDVEYGNARLRSSESPNMVKLADEAQARYDAAIAAARAALSASPAPAQPGASAP